MALNRTRGSVVAYVMLMVLLYASKPPLMFTEDGRMKAFSTAASPHTSLLSFGVCAVLLAVLMFFAFSLLDLIFL
jgi:hypothetical protein